MLFYALDEYAGTLNLNLVESFANRFRRFGRNPAGAPIDNDAIAIYRTQVAPDGDIARSEVELNAKRFEHTSADPVSQGIVSEQRQVARTAPGRDSPAYGQVEPEISRLGQRIEIGSAGCFQFGRAACLSRQSTESIQDQEQN
jgi:hypothetical protein